MEVFPAISLIKGQVKHVDTSLYNIIKIETVDGRSDTSFVKREDFKKLAKEFTEVPDISSPKIKNDYVEDQFYDETLQSIILTYITTEKDNEVQRQDVIINQANASGNNDVETIILHTMKNKSRTDIDKNMVWYVNKKFLVVTKSNRKNEPEKIHKLEVIWNDGSTTQL